VISADDFDKKRENKEINTIHAPIEEEMQTVDALQEVLGFRPEK
jgi:hypothetical protein